LTAEYAPGTPASLRTPGLTLTSVQAAAVWLMMFSTFFVRFEPAPCDLLFAIALMFYVAGSGLSVTVLAVPLIFWLFTYNLGAFTSYLQVMDEDKTGMFVVTSCYMAVSAVFFCFYVQDDTERRFAVFKNGYVAGAVVASVAGLVGYFNIGGTGAYLSPIFRAQGFFKDPNVLSTYLLLPALLMVQDVMLGTRSWRFMRYMGLLLVLACLFLAFSRGAWMSFLLASMMMVVLTFALTPSKPLRTRIILLAVLGAVLLVAVIAGLLSIDTVRAAFEDRATLAKDYDSGQFGRFSNQINAIPMLLERPFGFGPLQFHTYFGLDPHNVYLNAFGSYGWLGGISYVMLILSTLVIGFKGVMIRTPWQGPMIALFCSFFSTALQGVQIDTDHWRHFYWMLGLVWGFYAASAGWASRNAARAAPQAN
jgi:O-antigen ligase